MPIPSQLKPPDGNLLAALPTDFSVKVFEKILERGPVCIERIVSRGHTSPAEGWWDQEEDEWVLVLRGGGTIQFADSGEITLRAGDYLFIPAHKRHRLTWTEPDQATVWLAIFWPKNSPPPAT
jgi:cupin 2 domain-containing protein